MPCLFLVPSRRLCNNTCNGVLKRLVPCLKCMELAYWYSVLCGEHKNEKIWQKIFDQTVSLTFPKIHEFGGPPVVPSKKFGCPFIKLHRRFKGICHCQIHMPVLVICYQTYYWKMRVGSKFLTWKFVQSCSFLQSPLTYHQHRYIIYWLDIG